MMTNIRCQTMTRIMMRLAAGFLQPVKALKLNTLLDGSIFSEPVIP
ncbi:hypothetical protein [Thermoactinomyces mirandus]|uniref:Uncharacterized protein n=1 Tax=Thermoactinomyces mirandus TaxID=2756294 RepID=A0A7W1XSI5_9BACL|nr:hypothetical protein [Thermoactinomyces mirandus]MBA4602275.1 hypothetical protein [Thermoactinomyces mirandus]